MEYAVCLPNPACLLTARGRRHLVWFVISLIMNQGSHPWPWEMAVVNTLFCRCLNWTWTITWDKSGKHKQWRLYRCYQQPVVKTKSDRFNGNNSYIDILHFLHNPSFSFTCMFGNPINFAGRQQEDAIFNQSSVENRICLHFYHFSSRRCFRHWYHAKNRYCRYQHDFLLKFLLVDYQFLTWLLCCQPIRNHVRKLLFAEIDYNASVMQCAASVSSM